MYDPIVEGVRKIRNSHSKKFNYDVSLIVEDYQKRSKSIRSKIKNDFNKVSSLDSFSAPLQKNK